MLIYKYRDFKLFLSLLGPKALLVLFSNRLLLEKSKQSYG